MRSGRKFLLILIIIIPVIILTFLVCFFIGKQDNTDFTYSNSLTVKATPFPGELALNPDSGEDVPESDKEPCELFSLGEGKVARISIETVICSFNDPEALTGISLKLMEYTVHKGEKGFDELFEYLAGFRFIRITDEQFWTGKSQEDYDWPYGIRILPVLDETDPVKNTEQPVQEYPYNIWAVRSGKTWHFPEEENYFIKLNELIAEKGTVIGPYLDLQVYK